MDTRIEDMKKAGWSDEEIERAIASPQTGSQTWMNRPAGLTVEQYRTYADTMKARFTPEQIKYLSSMDAVKAFKSDPVNFLVDNTLPHIVFSEKETIEKLVSKEVLKYLRDHP